MSGYLRIKFAGDDIEKQCLKNGSGSFPSGQSENDPRSTPAGRELTLK